MVPARSSRPMPLSPSSIIWYQQTVKSFICAVISMTSESYRWAGKDSPILEMSMRKVPELIPVLGSQQVTKVINNGGRLPFLSARPAVTSSAAEHHRPLASTKLYCLVTEAHVCKQLSQGCTWQHGGRNSNL